MYNVGPYGIGYYAGNPHKVLRYAVDTALAVDVVPGIFPRTAANAALAVDTATAYVSRLRTVAETVHAADAVVAFLTRLLTTPYGLGYESNGRRRTGHAILTVEVPITPPPTIQTVELAAPITSAIQTTITITEPLMQSELSGDQYIQIASEVMLVTAGFGTTILTVVRAQLGTSAIVSAIVGTLVAITSPYHTIDQAYETYPAPTLDSGYFPEAWEPTAQTLVPWGKLRLVAGGQDSTFIRDAPIMIQEWSDAENFGDDTITFVIYSSTAFEPLGGSSAVMQWLTDNAGIQLQCLHPDSTNHILFEGDVHGIDDAFDGKTSTITVHGVGVLKTLDDRVTKPRFNPDKIDIGLLIAQFFNAECDEGFRAAKMIPQTLSRYTTEVGEYGALLGTSTIQDLLVSTVFPDGSMADGVSTYVMTNKRPRGAVLQVKDKSTIDFVIQCGGRGVTHQLTRDPGQVINTIYGQGQDEAGLEWRNTKYPNLPVAPPAYPLPTSPLQTFHCGDSHTGLLPFSSELRTRGYKDLVSQDRYSCDDVDVVERFQTRAGLTVDGIIGPQTWNAAFQTGTNAATLYAYVSPLWVDRRVEKHLFNARGGIIGTNPDYNPAYVRREKLEQFGTLTRASAELIARMEIDQFGSVGYVGTVSLTNIDPPQMCALDIRSGMNFTFKGHRGADRTMHVAASRKQPGQDLQGGSSDRIVALTVSEKFHDRMTLAQFLRRERGIVGMSDRVHTQHRKSAHSHDLPPFDADAGAGYLPPNQAQTGGLWNFYQIPAGAAADIVRVRIIADTPTQMSACVFDRPTTPAKLLSITDNMLADPTDTDSNGNDGWAAHASALRVAGLQWANGGASGMQGYWPNTTTGALTGVLDDSASWTFKSKSNPWAWLGVWTVDSCTISGDPNDHFWCLFAGNTQ